MSPNDHHRLKKALPHAFAAADNGLYRNSRLTFA
jgi:hypothetical protein